MNLRKTYVNILYNTAMKINNLNLFLIDKFNDIIRKILSINELELRAKRGDRKHAFKDVE